MDLNVSSETKMVPLKDGRNDNTFVVSVSKQKCCESENEADKQTKACRLQRCWAR